MYGPLKTAVGADADPTLARKILAGSLSGGIATLITNPMELIKTRLQSNSSQGGALAVIRSVVAKDGVTGLWKGTMPSAVRPLRHVQQNSVWLGPLWIYKCRC